jgi:fatty-acyl-CoA synthase
LNRTLIGGSAAPRWMVEAFAAMGVVVRHGWGMTELSPMGSITSPKPEILALSHEAQIDQNLKQGLPIYGVEARIIGPDGAELPHDDVQSGQLQVRGPCVVGEYFKAAGGDVLTADGWFDSGDIAAIDHFGYIRITDRTKDVIKSGGEWISSIELEGEASGCPGVKEAAAIGIAHPRWVERPVLVVVREAGSDVSAEDVQTWLRSRVAKWWLPDRVEFVDELPHTATGKLDKKQLRLWFADMVLG